MKKLLMATFILALIVTSASAVGPAEYDGGTQVNIETDSLNAGETLNAEISATNSDNRPIVEGYIIVNIASGDEPYYPSQMSDDDNVFHQRKIKDINLNPGDNKVYDLSYRLPEDLRSGDYRVETYFKTERTPVKGLPAIYSTPSYDSFNVSSSSGDYPSLDISRTETFFTGVNKAIGDWDPESLNPRNTTHPSLTGPVGVLTTDSMDAVEGQIKINNPSRSSIPANLDIVVCEWDDTACSNRVESVTKSVDVPPSGTTVPVEVENPSEPSAYAIKMNVSAGGRTHSIYRNRIIRGGNTSRIRKLSVSSPYIQKGDELSVGLVAGVSPDHYNDPSAEGIKADVIVESDGEEVLSKSKKINRLSNVNPFEQLYYNSTVDDTLTEFTVSADLSANGQTYDSYSYEVDYSDFSNGVAKVNLKSYVFNNETLNAKICGRTDSGGPASGEVQVLVREDLSLLAESQRRIENCSTFSFNGIESGNYKLVANHGSQTTFNITEGGLEPSDMSGKEGGGNNYVLALIVVAALVIGVMLLRGVRK